MVTDPIVPNPLEPIPEPEPIVIPPRPKPEPVDKAQTVTVTAEPDVANALAMAAYVDNLADGKALAIELLRRRLVEQERTNARADYEARYAVAEETVDILMKQVV